MKNIPLSPSAELSVNEAAAYMNFGQKKTRALMVSGEVRSYPNSNGQLVTCPRECDKYLEQVWDARWVAEHGRSKRRGVKAA